MPVTNGFLLFYKKTTLVDYHKNNNGIPSDRDLVAVIE